MKLRSRSRAPVVAALLFLAFGAASCNAGAEGDDTSLINLVALTSQRLALAVPVAQWKWANHRPITDAPREAALLADVDTRARAINLDPAFAHAFFQDQIDASKEIQTALFDAWRTSRPPEGSAPDLATSTRPLLDRLTGELLGVLVRVQSMRNAEDCPSRVAQSVASWKTMTRYGVTDAKALATALSHVCAAGGMAGSA